MDKWEWAISKSAEMGERFGGAKWTTERAEYLQELRREIESQVVSFDQLREANVLRCEEVFHALTEWSLSDWATAATGELGEAANLIKKIRRRDFKLTDVVGKGRGMITIHEWLGNELADVVIYVDLLAARAGINLGKAVRRKFNEVSTRTKSSYRL